MIPILLNHQQQKILGVFEDGVVTFNEETSLETLFQIFPGAGVIVNMEEARALEGVKGDASILVKKCTVVEFSLVSQPKLPKV